MFEFTKGKEMEELYELWSAGRIRIVVSKDKYYSIVVVEPKTIIVESMSDNKPDFDINTINWRETAKLVKSNNGLVTFEELGQMGASIIEAHREIGSTVKEESERCKVKKDDKVEKIEVRCWSDLLKLKVIYSSEKNISYKNFTMAKHNNLKVTVEILNALGGNFEYIHRIVIDTFDKFREFLEKNYMEYRPRQNQIFKVNGTREGFYCLDGAEERFDVDLKILKEG